MHATLRRFTELVDATARAHLAPGTPAIESRVVALSLVGTLERVVTEWQAGELDIGVDELTEQCVRLYSSLLER
jgi:hypothetical protein